MRRGRSPRWLRGLRGLRLAAVGLVALVLAAITALAGAGAAPSSASAAVGVSAVGGGHHAKAPTPVTLLLGSRGPSFTSFGFDIKRGGVARQLYDPRTLAPTTLARTVFGDGRMGVIRIPVFASATAFHDGRPTYAGYGAVVDAVHAVQRVDPHVKVFASLVTVCPGSARRCLEFDRSLKAATEGPIAPAAYGRFLAGYLDAMDAAGVHVDYLGIDNEGNGGTRGTWLGSNNEGQISGARFAATFDTIAAHYDGALPRAVFNDSTAPDLPTLSRLTAREWARVAVVAHHYSSDRRQRVGGAPHDRHALPYFLARLDQLARVRHHKAVWNTEFHFAFGSGRTIEDDYGHVVVTMKALADQLDDHGTGITFWGYLDPDVASPVRALERAVVSSLRAPGGPGAAGGRPVPTTDDDGEDPGAGVTKFTTRGIVLGHDVLVWAINATDQDRTRLPVVLRRGGSPRSATLPVPAGRVSAMQWRRAGRDLRQTSAGVSVTHHTARVTFPAHSITLVRIRGVL